MANETVDDVDTVGSRTYDVTAEVGGGIYSYNLLLFRTVEQFVVHGTYLPSCCIISFRPALIG